ncbi:hypothetical protein OG21DRAFT_1505684 [Imleria badia]|nr:hypothetical protein OG21DRAFT_1505684 [Imleria badia]
MVLTRSAAKKYQPYEVQNNVNPTSQDNTVRNAPGAKYAADRLVTRKKRRPRPQDNDVGGPSERSSCSKSSGFLQLNLDVIFLVASNMHPMDLLSLACTCKSLRYLLMERSASFAWRAARLQVEDLPNCPTDLSEQQYARLLFNNNCHGCENRAGKVYWKIRRRYCSSCRVKQLRLLTSCESPICEGGILPAEKLVMNSGLYYLSKHQRNCKWIDRDQLDALMDKLRATSDAAQLLDDMRKQYHCTNKHADNCIAWEEGMVEERTEIIFERLRHLGHQDEIRFQGLDGIKGLYESAFTSVRPLTDAEWARMYPQWLEIMQEIQSLKENESFSQLRLRILEAEYDEWVQCPPSSVPTFDILPHVADVAAFRPFDAIIKTPGEIKMDEKMFTSTLMELPTWIQEWRHQVDAEITALCAVSDCHLSPISTEKDGQSLHHSGLSKLDLEADRYNLASIMFRPSTPHHILCNYTELLLLPMFQSYKPPTYPDVYRPRSSYPWSTLGEDGKPVVRLCREAPYVVRACGLDPAVATVDDMECRNARLVCLMCDNARLVRSWTNAICHVEVFHRGVPYDPSIPRWRLLDDEHIDLIESVESQGGLEPPEENYFRCLLCRPRVGDVWLRQEALQHLARR